MAMKLNSEQLAVVNSDAQRICVLAGAGTGKTETMTQRIIHLVNNGVNPLSILTLTFTNAGAVNMQERYVRYTNAEKNPVFATFHAFCYSLICSDKDVRKAVGYSRSVPPKIVNESYIKAIALRLKNKMGIKYSDEKIDSMDIPSKDKFAVEQYKKALDMEVQKSNVITFDMISERVSKLFSDNSPVIAKYISRYDYIFVDEFQDTDQVQFDFLMAFNHKNLLVVGDPLQNLYSFRGTTSEMIKSLAFDSNWTTYRLSENYRSTEEICNFANTVSEYAGDYRVNLKGHGHGESVTEMNSNDMDWICSYIQKYHKWHPDESTAVIFRVNKQVAQAVSTFKALGEDVQTKSDLHNIENILNCIKDTEYAARWISASVMNNADLLQWSYEHRDDSAEKRLEILKDNPFTEEIFEQIDSVKAWIADMGFDLAKDEKAIIESFTSGEVSDGYRIYAGTIHSVKGLEYDTVFVVGVDSKSFKLSNEDNMNCYYVAVTRAKQNLVIFRG